MTKLNFATIVAVSLLMIAGCGSKPEIQPAESQTAPEVTTRKDLIAKQRAMDHFTKGDLYERTRDLEKAADEYRLALFYDPTSDELRRSLARVNFDLYRFDEAIDLSLAIARPSLDDYLMIGRCHNLSGNADQAVKYFKKATELDSSLPEPWEFLARYYTAVGDIGQSEKYYTKLIEVAPNGDTWRLELASVFIKTKDVDRAVKIYQEMIADDSLNYRAFLGMATVNEIQGDTAKADSLYKLIAYGNWDNPRVLSIVSEGILRLNDLETALEVTGRITEIYPEDYYAVRRYGLLLFTLERYQTADSVLMRLTELVPDDPIVYYYLGRVAQAEEQYARAESLYAKTLAMDDTLTQAWVNLAFTRNQLGGFEAAMVTFDTARTRCPKYESELNYFTGVFLSRQQMYDLAVIYYQKVIDQNPKDIDALFNMAAAFERTGRYDEAEKAFENVLALETDNAMALNYLGYMYADNGINLKTAEKLIKRALEISPDNGAYLDSYAWVMFKMGKYKEALKYQQQAIETGSEDPVLFDHMGDICQALNMPEEARNNWQKALELEPANESIQAKLK